MEYINSLKFSILDDLLYKKELKRIIILTLYNAHYEKMKSLLNILSLQKIIINNIFYQSERDKPILNIKVSMNIGNPDFLKNLLKMCLQKEIFLLVSMEKFQYFIPDFEINLIETNIWVATIIKSERIPIEMLLEWFKLLESYSIKVLIISDLTDISFKCIECKLKVPKLLKKKEIKEKAFFLTQKYSLDVLLQSDSVYKKKKRLIAFDMDSTLIEQEMINEIARFCGIFEKVSVSYITFT